MKKDEAIKIIEQVCAQYRGTLQDHQTIQAALEIIKGDNSEPKQTKNSPK